MLLHFVIASVVFIASMIGLSFLFISLFKTKRRRIFFQECMAVAADICLHTGADLYQLCRSIESNLDKLSKSSNAKVSEGIVRAYNDDDYIDFVYLSSLEYASQYISEDKERAALESFCVPPKYYDRFSLHDPKSASSKKNYSDSYAVFYAFVAALILTSVVASVL